MNLFSVIREITSFFFLHPTFPTIDHKNTKFMYRNKMTQIQINYFADLLSNSRKKIK